MPRKSSTKGKKPKTTGTKAVNKTVERVLKDFRSSWDYCVGSWHDRWSDNYALYHSNRVKRGYNGITDTFVPMTFSTIETMTSALFGTKPTFDFIPPQEKQDQQTDILNALLDYYWDKDQWNIKIISWGRNFLMLGTSIVYLFWDGDCPRLINVPLRDFFIDPMATSLENARYMGRRYLTTKDELAEFQVVDPETGQMRPKYKNLNKLDGYRSLENTDKEEKDMFYGSTVSKPDDTQVEVIEYWTPTEVISVGNRCEVIEESENYYLTKAKAQWKKQKKSERSSVEPFKGIMPFAGLRDYVDESLFYAKGEVDFMLDQQELLNDITNQNIDAVTYTLNPMFRLDPKYATLINEIESMPGAGIPAEAGAFEWLPFQPIPSDAFAERQNIKNEIRETTASNEIVKGAGQQPGSDPTATEVNAQIAGAGQRLGLKVTQIENEGFHRLAKIVFEMVKLYVTEKMAVRIVGKDGTRWEDYDPQEFQGEYEPRVQLEITIENQKQQEAVNAKELMAAFAGDPEINQQELKKMVLIKSFDLDPDEVEVLMQPNLMPGMPQEGMMPEGMPPEMPMPGMEMGMGMPGTEMPMEAPLPPEPLPTEMPTEEPMMPEPIVNLASGELLEPTTGEVMGLIDLNTGEVTEPETGAVIGVIDETGRFVALEEALV